jgi:hypothetical protein
LIQPEKSDTEFTDSAEWLDKIESKEITFVDRLCMLMLGIGCVVIVNSVFTDLGFFIGELGNNVVFLIPLALNVP